MNRGAWLYILRCADGSYYVGTTRKSLEERLAEHNDGLIRTPYLGKMYSPEMLSLFQDVKNIFDPKNIFNPGKKVPAQTGEGTKIYLASHIGTQS